MVDEGGCRRAVSGLREFVARLLQWWQTAPGASVTAVRGLQPSAEFEAAAAALRAASGVATTKQLQLYALYKQTTAGDAPAVGPASIDMSARAKRAAWTRVRGMAATEAMSAYIASVDSELSAAGPARVQRTRASSEDDGLAGLGDDSSEGGGDAEDLDADEYAHALASVAAERHIGTSC